jgi:hypothetical protein
MGIFFSQIVEKSATGIEGQFAYEVQIWVEGSAVKYILSVLRNRRFCHGVLFIETLLHLTSLEDIFTINTTRKIPERKRIFQCFVWKWEAVM